jgi:hypothetical protein
MGSSSPTFESKSNSRMVYPAFGQDDDITVLTLARTA